MKPFFSTPVNFGAFELPHRLIQGPLAGISCAPFRELFSRFTPPAYAVSEMLSAHDVVNKQEDSGRLLFRSYNEGNLCYQISGTHPDIMALAATKLVKLGANLIDINCGCPKPKIRKKGAGSALLENRDLLIGIIRKVRQSIMVPLTVKIRIQGDERDIELAKSIENEGVDALIVHGRRWSDDYTQPCHVQQIANIKRALSIPVVANGDIFDVDSLLAIHELTNCDAFMLSRAGTGKPWLYQKLLSGADCNSFEIQQQIHLFIEHIRGIAVLENEHQALLQSRKLVKYYFRQYISESFLERFYRISNMDELQSYFLLEHRVPLP